MKHHRIRRPAQAGVWLRCRRCKIIERVPILFRSFEGSQRVYVTTGKKHTTVAMCIADLKRLLRDCRTDQAQREKDAQRLLRQIAKLKASQTKGK